MVLNVPSLEGKKKHGYILKKILENQSQLKHRFDPIHPQKLLVDNLDKVIYIISKTTNLLPSGYLT